MKNKTQPVSDASPTRSRVTKIRTEPVSSSTNGSFVKTGLQRTSNIKLPSAYTALSNSYQAPLKWYETKTTCASPRRSREQGKSNTEKQNLIKVPSRTSKSPSRKPELTCDKNMYYLSLDQSKNKNLYANFKP